MVAKSQLEALKLQATEMKDALIDKTAQLEMQSRENEAMSEKIEELKGQVCWWDLGLGLGVWGRRHRSCRRHGMASPHIDEHRQVMDLRKQLAAKEREVSSLAAAKGRALAGESNIRGQLAETQIEFKKTADLLAEAKSEVSRLSCSVEGSEGRIKELQGSMHGLESKLRSALEERDRY